MKRFVIALLAALVADMAGAAPGRIVAGDNVIYDYWHVVRTGGQLVPDASSPTGKIWRNANTERLNKTLLVPAIRDHGFELDLAIRDLPEGAGTVRLYLEHPPMKLPSGKVVRTRDMRRRVRRMGEYAVTGFSYFFDQDYEMTPGDWRLRFSHGDKLLLDVTYSVVPEGARVALKRRPRGAVPQRPALRLSALQ